MAFQVSPGINVSEINLTTTVGKGISTSTGAFAGNFKWGPVEERVLISSEVELVNTFFKPDSDTYKNFFSVANFLTYSNACYVVRTGDANTSPTLKNAAANTAILVKNDSDYLTKDSATLTAAGEFLAKYPGSLGNAIMIAALDANTAAYNSNILTANTSLGITDAMVSAVGKWSDQFHFVPNTSEYANTYAGSNDEMHIIVIAKDSSINGISGSVLEKFEGVSKIKGAKSEDGSTNFYVNVINNTSNYLRAGGKRILGANDSLPASTHWTSHSKTFIMLSNGANASTPDISTGYGLFANSDEVDVSLIFTGDLNGETNAAQAKNIITIAENRKDAVAFLSAPYSLVSSALPGSTITTNLVNFIQNTISKSSSYYVLDSGWKYQYDKYNDTYRWVPLNGDIAGLCARTDQSRDPWWSPAGFNRGSINNCIKLSWNPTQAQRDQIYKVGINPVVSFPGEGTILYGDKTGLAKPSAFDRINVRRLFIVLEKSIATAAKYSLFEFNDEFTRSQFRAMVESFLREVKSRRGIYDFTVVCDNTNNTPDVIDNNQFVGDIYLKPARSINYIQLNFVAVRTGVDFNEIIGQF